MRQRKLGYQPKGCMKCGAEFSNSERLLDHMKEKHPEMFQKKEEGQA